MTEAVDQDAVVLDPPAAGETELVRRAHVALRSGTGAVRAADCIARRDRRHGHLQAPRVRIEAGLVASAARDRSVGRSCSRSRGRAIVAVIVDATRDQLDA
jgi:hypothetical protein